MLLLFLALALTDKQQSQHDLTEWRMHQRIQAYEKQISDMWRPPTKLLVDYRKAKGCYLKFHLYRAKDCSTQLQKVETDLGNIQVADSGIQ
jgi:hypothetical protein